MAKHLAERLHSASSAAVPLSTDGVAGGGVTDFGVVTVEEAVAILNAENAAEFKAQSGFVLNIEDDASVITTALSVPDLWRLFSWLIRCWRVMPV